MGKKLRPARRVYPQRFEEAWSHWPRKTDKEGSYSYWVLSVDNLVAEHGRDEEWLVARVIAHTRTQDCREAGAKFTPALRRWLREERYLHPVQDSAPGGSVTERR